jgi:hypothetical protein
MSLSTVSSSVSPWLATLSLSPTITISCLPFLRDLSGSHSRNQHGRQFPGIIFTCPNRRNSSSVISHIFFPISS